MKPNLLKYIPVFLAGIFSYFPGALLGVIVAALFVLPMESVALEKLTIASLENFEPYSWHDGEQERGIDVEIILEAAKRSGFEIEFVFVPWERVLSSVRLGKVDGGSPAFRKPDREVYAHYTSVPLHVSRTNAFTLKKSPFNYQNIQSLFGFKVAKLRGFSIGESFDAAASNQEISVLEINALDSALQMLVRKRFDVFVNNDLPTLYWAKQLGLSNHITMKSPAINPGEGSFLIFSKLSPRGRGEELKDKFDLALKAMTADGSIETIIARYVR